MNREQAEAAVRTAVGRVAPEADLELVPPDASLRQELDLDSLDFLALLENLALLTGVNVPESDYAAVDGLEALVGYLAAHAAA
jgi:acyl carrier protein